jgi:hypothetical protein
MSKIYLNLFIISVDIKTEKKYILSKCNNEICIPQISLDDLNKNKIKNSLSEYIRSIIPMHTLGILPQIITLHSSNLANAYKKLNKDFNDTDIQTVYGCLVDPIPPVKDDFYWIEFNYELPNDYSSNIFEVCQNLK